MHDHGSGGIGKWPRGGWKGGARDPAALSDDMPGGGGGAVPRRAFPVTADVRYELRLARPGSVHGAASRFLIGAGVGEGSFGAVYNGTDLDTGIPVAIKLENRTVQRPQFPMESRVYTMLSGSVGFPLLFWMGAVGNYHAIVQERLGMSLEQLLVLGQRRMSLHSVMQIAHQIISRIEFMHDHNILHRDLKPENIMMGLGANASTVYLIDYGLATYYRDPYTHRHVPYSEIQSFTGTARYASVRAHRGMEQSRRDDVEALGYIMVYLLLGALPWQGIRHHDRRERGQMVMRHKAQQSMDAMFPKVPSALRCLVSYSQELPYSARPSYTMLRERVRTFLLQRGHVYDGIFDWHAEFFFGPAPARIPGTAAGAEESRRDAAASGADRSVGTGTATPHPSHWARTQVLRCTFEYLTEPQQGRVQRRDGTIEPYTQSRTYRSTLARYHMLLQAPHPDTYLWQHKEGTALPRSWSQEMLCAPLTNWTRLRARWRAFSEPWHPILPHVKSEAHKPFNPSESEATRDTTIRSVSLFRRQFVQQMLEDPMAHVPKNTVVISLEDGVLVNDSQNIELPQPLIERIESAVRRESAHAGGRAPGTSIPLPVCPPTRYALTQRLADYRKSTMTAGLCSTRAALSGPAPPASRHSIATRSVSEHMGLTVSLMQEAAHRVVKHQIPDLDARPVPIMRPNLDLSQRLSRPQ